MPSNSEILTSAVKSVTAAPEPAPSAKIIADLFASIVTLAPEPCVIDRLWFVLLRIIYILALSFCSNVTVQVPPGVPVNFIAL